MVLIIDDIKDDDLSVSDRSHDIEIGVVLEAHRAGGGKHSVLNSSMNDIEGAGGTGGRAAILTEHPGNVVKHESLGIERAHHFLDGLNVVSRGRLVCYCVHRAVATDVFSPPVHIGES